MHVFDGSDIRAPIAAFQQFVRPGTVSGELNSPRRAQMACNLTHRRDLAVNRFTWDQSFGIMNRRGPQIQCRPVPRSTPSICHAWVASNHERIKLPLGIHP